MLSLTQVKFKTLLWPLHMVSKWSVLSVFFVWFCIFHWTIMPLSIWCLTVKDYWGNIYNNTVHTVNTARTTWSPTIFCIQFLHFFFILRKDRALGLFTSSGNSSLCTCLCSIKLNLPINPICLSHPFPPHINSYPSNLSDL